MFEGLRARLAGLAAAGSDFPAPGIADGAAAEGMRGALAAFHGEAPGRYASFFLRGKPLLAARGERPLFRALEGAGLAARLAPSFYAPCVRLFPLLGKFVAADLPTRARADQVFPLMFEQVYLVRNMGVRPGDEVLELCLGSGVNSLFAADRAGRVAGVEVSGRAAAFARFNRDLNGSAVEVLEGSLFEPVGDRRFDLVLVNPPFEPVPPGEDWFLHSHGGEDGLDVVRALLAGLPAHLSPAGRFEIIAWSPAPTEGPLLVDLLRGALPRHRLAVHVLGEGPLEDHIEPFERSPRYGAWREGLRSRGIDRVCFLFVSAAPGGPGVEVLRPEAEVAACHAVADAWR